MVYFMEEPPGLTGVCIASVAFIAACLFLFRNKGNLDNVTTDTASSTSSATGTAGKTIAKDQLLRSVFSVKQTPSTVTGNGYGASSTSTTGGRPFESSYYFAHNGQSTGGGYKDGLRAEDFVMNGPRLLSRGGVRVIDDHTISTVDAKHGTGEECTPPQSNEANNTTTERTKHTMVASRPITKYMWDDDGNGNIAKIHIDSLPISSTESIRWEDAGISSVEQIEVRLTGDNNEGLYIGITSQNGMGRHHLHVPKTYGEVESVKAIPKRNKLLVKITKKEKMRKRYSKHSRQSTAKDDGIWTIMTKSISNFIGDHGRVKCKEEYASQSWPRLSASSVGGLGGGSCEIDDKLFKEMGMEGTGVDGF